MPEAVLNSREFSVKFLIGTSDKKLVQNVYKENEKALEELENTRKQTLKLSTDMHHRFEFANLFTKGTPGQKLDEVLQSLNITLSDFMKNFKNSDQFMSFFQNIYTMDVFVTLIVARDREKPRKIELNDTKDLGFLCTAVPYCNAIITEEF
ncbi:MAG: hypothetical protein DWB56_12105 [Candidatus Jettenia sp.]|uniref:Uncharacterized protein n=1 Tax=Candidatus Jettenia caeni TaxID=247490 RepID=I3IGX5_9BACT|nr:hypothetical protein [Candidatus Jettenia sp. AMX1]MBC6929680.1 hypothetical protein [Candidatus Jettenia sp.]NUN22660.1 hypothetical protein [Candidatus Jettenia caeni]KAA0248935.1 MAG: hypothetical protein EDM77_10570 [Candidatus Jettenia sp. AMX1]MCE7881271.1 hypothetical protein [Candidatus Jettenia sp. AMX1]MCQ3928113.1 hypothetical protein [Candidatus Jettenia sp.]